MQINLPSVVEEIRLVSDAYEQALIANDLDTIASYFLDHSSTLRFGVAENLYGYAAIDAFRRSRPAGGLSRTRTNVLITTFGQDFAVYNCEDRRESSDRIGRTSQTWVRVAGAWKIVSAHVSLIGPPSA
jgi:hypothetical protein